MIIILILTICIYFIFSNFWANDELIIFGIGGSTLLFYILLHIIIPITVKQNYASDLLGVSFPVELIICATPSIITLGIIGMINSLIWTIKKRSR